MLVVGTVLLTQIVWDLVAGLLDGDPAFLLLDQTGRALVVVSPGVFYLCALWALHSTFGALSRSDQVFAPALARGLRAVGSNLMWGAGMEMLGAPLLLRWVDREPGGAVLSFSASALVLGMLGLSLFLLARLLARASAQEAELAEII